MMIIFCIGTTLKIFLLPTLLLKSVGRDGLIVISVLLIFELLLLIACLIAIKLSPNLTFTQALERHFGKIAARVIAAILVLYACLKLLLLFTETRSFFESSLFDQFVWPVMGLPLFGLAALVAAKSLSGVSRLFEIFAPLVFASLIILGIMIAPNVDFGNALPLFTAGGGTIARQSLSFAVWTGDFVLLLLFVGKTRPQGKLITLGIISAVIGTLLVIFFAVVLTATFANLPHLIEYGHNMRNLAIFGAGNLAYGRIDIILFAVWAIGLIIQSLLYGYFAVSLLSYIFGVSTGKYRLLLSGILMTILYVVTIVMFSSSSTAYQFARSWPRFLAIGVQCLVIIGAIVMSIIFGRRGKNGKKNTAAKNQT